MSDFDTVLGRFARPEADQRTRLAVVSDLHLSLNEHGTWRVSHRTEERLEAAVRSLNEQELDSVLFNGDLVQSGERPEFEAFDRIIKGVEAPFFAVPENHDLIDWDGTSDSNLTLPEFERRYVPDELPYQKRVGGVDLIALNSNTSTEESVTDSFEGRLSSETLAWLDDVLDDADCPLVAVHHALDPVRDFYRSAQEQYPIENGGSPGFANAAALVDVLAEHDVPLVLSGHLHFPAVVRAGSVREFTLPPLGPFPGGYTVFDVDEHGTTARFHPVADRKDRIEALGYGLDHDRVLLAAAQHAGLPLVDDLHDSTTRGPEER